MPVTVNDGKKDYPSTNNIHGEEEMFNKTKFQSGNFTVTMNAWPCTGERHHNCHQLFKTKSVGRIITVVITGDHGGYARNHGKAFGAKGTITYNNGVATYS
jgi:hypothetical protein